MLVYARARVRENEKEEKNAGEEEEEKGPPYYTHTRVWSSSGDTIVRTRRTFLVCFMSFSGFFSSASSSRSLRHCPRVSALHTIPSHQLCAFFSSPSFSLSSSSSRVRLFSSHSFSSVERAYPRLVFLAMRPYGRTRRRDEVTAVTTTAVFRSARKMAAGLHNYI